MKKHVYLLMASLLILVFILSSEETAIADPGDLDSCFGNNGVVTIDIGGFDTAIDVTTQTDGKIVLSGTTFGSSTDFAIVRYASNGTLDQQFSI